MRSKILLYYVLVITVVLSCETEQKRQENTTSQSKHLPLENKDTVLLQRTTLKPCNCTDYLYQHSYQTDITFTNKNTTEEQQKFQKWATDALRLKVKSIGFPSFDTIPSKFRVFENVERVRIGGREGIYGLEIFPKLKILEFWGAKVEIPKKEEWVRKIEVIHAEKSHFTGISTLGIFQNLKVLELAHSGMSVMDFDTLHCLQRLSLNAYLGHDAKLRERNLQKMPCLESLEIIDAYATLNGIPQGLLSSHLQKVRIRNTAITQQEKALLDSLKRRLVK